MESLYTETNIKHIELHNKTVIPMETRPHIGATSFREFESGTDIPATISDLFSKYCHISLHDYLDYDDSSSDSQSELDIMDIFNEDDYIDISFLIYDMMETYIQDHFVEQSSPTFIEVMVQSISETLFYLWEDYGFSIEETSETELRQWITQEISEFMESFWPPRQGICVETLAHGRAQLREKIERLLSIEIPEQRSQEWYNQRNNLLTASNIWKVFASQAQYNSLVVEKCKPTDQGTESAMRSVSTSSSLHWGILFEPITAEIYCMKNKTKLGEFGCIVHPEYPFIGASPDGINIDESSPLYGRMVEIKNVVSRQITGVPLESYWIQMQLQMEICDLDECDFIETKFAKMSREEYYGDEDGDSDNPLRGVILHVGPRIFIPFFNQTHSDNLGIEPDNRKIITYATEHKDPFYVYIPLDIARENVDSWIQEYKTKNPNLVVMETIYWKLVHYSCVFVHRNREWFQAALPKIRECWETIEHDRIHGYQHRLSSKKKATEVIHTDTTCSIQMSAKPSVCLVKLDYV